MKKILLFINIIIIFLFTIKTSFAENIKKTFRAEYIMGTVFEIEIYENNDKLANEAISLAFNEIRKYDQILSNYKENSEINNVIKKAYNKPTKISNELYEVLKDSLYFSELTKGKFDITIEPLIKLWGFKNKNFKKPSEKEIKKVLRQIGYKNIILDEENKTILLKKSNLSIDFGAIGKGFAIGKAVEILKAKGIKSAFINSNSNQYYLGTPPDKDFWLVGIKDPKDESKIIKVLKVKDTALSTSGDYENYFFDNGVRYSHILDPDTGFPIKEKIASTIICKDSSYADILSTAFLLVDNNIKKNIKKNVKIDYSIVISEKKNKLILDEE